MTAPDLNPIERKVLTVLVAAAGDFGHYSFAGIVAHARAEHRWRLDRKQVRRACRSLARKGLAQFGSGLFTEDGEVAGSGYTATREGVHLVEGNDA